MSLYVYVRSAAFALGVTVLLSIVFVTGCGTTSSKSVNTTTSSNPVDSAPVSTVTVNVTPSSVSLAAGQNQTFSAAVSGTGNSAVSWFVNGIAGGNSNVGTISLSGIYTAPAPVPSSTVTVSAVSAADITKSANATVNFTSSAPNPPSVTITINPTGATLGGGQSQLFTATVMGSSNSQVSWAVNGISGGSSGLGIITSSGLYTAPATLPNSPVSISAVSLADPNKSASVMVSFSSPAPPPASGTNYYVSPNGSDSSDGSSTHPWLTIQHAAAVARAGATVHVAAGNYSGAITTSTSGTATGRISFISDQQWGAVIRAASVDIVWTNLGDYVDIEGFDIAGSTADTCNGIINYASYVRIIGNNVHDVGGNASTCTYGAGIVNHQNRAGHDDDVIGNLVHDIGDLSQASSLQHGIYHANLRGHIWNNLVYRCAGWGIHLWHAANQVTISSNTVFNNNYGGILIGDGDDPGGFPAGVVNDNSVVTNNIVYRNGLSSGASGYGIEEYGATGTHNQYLNNLVYQNGPADWRLQNGITPVATIGADPQFANYQPNGGGDYHLRPGSSGLSTGTSFGAPGIDIAGALRPVSSPDIGVYQSNSTPGIWPFLP